MSAGTLTLTNNSTAVTGSGTAFTTDLKVNDFVVSVVGGVTYTLAVTAIGSNTSLTLTTAYGGPTTGGVAWTAVPNATLVGITAQVAADVAKAIRGLNLDKSNWQQVYSGSGNITVTLPDGSTFSGPSWNNLASSLASKANNTDPRLDTIGGKTGGAITGSVTLTGDLAGDRIITAGPGYGFAVRAGDNNRVEINNLQSTTVPEGTAVNWVNHRWYSGVAQTGVRRGGGADIKSYFVNISSGGAWEFLQGGNATASGTWTSGSDERHKHDIAPVKNALAAVLTFRGATYSKKDGEREVGLIAQDAEKACKEAIIYNGDRKFSDGLVIPNFKYLNTSGVSAAYHTEAVKELFNLLELSLSNPPEAVAMIAAIKAQSQIIANTVIENEEPRQEAPPEVPQQVIALIDEGLSDSVE